MTDKLGRCKATIHRQGQADLTCRLQPNHPKAADGTDGHVFELDAADAQQWQAGYFTGRAAGRQEALIAMERALTTDLVDAEERAGILNAVERELGRNPEAIDVAEKRGRDQVIAHLDACISTAGEPTRGTLVSARQYIVDKLTAAQIRR